MKARWIWGFALGVVCASISCNPGESSGPAPASVPSEAPTFSPTPEPTFTSKRHRVEPAPSSTVSVPPDTRSQAQIDIAACTAADGSWRCASKKPQTFAAGSSTPIIPVSWTVPNWFVNKSTGSDSNACTTALAACATKQEIWVHRWGMVGSGSQNCPRFQQTTTLEQDTSDTDNTDPFYPCASLEKGVSFILQGGPPTSTAAVFTLNTAKNTAAGTNALLSGSFSAGAPAAGVLVQNTTAGKSSRAWVYKTAGGANWNITQPDVPITVPAATLSPVEVDTWASTDTVNVLVPIAINLVSASATMGDFNGAFSNAFYLYNFTIFDPSGVGNDDVVIGPQVQVVEVSSQRAMNFTGNTETGPGAQFCTNCMQLALTSTTGLGQSRPNFFSGALGANSDLATAGALGSDIIIPGAVLEMGGGISSNVFLDGTLTVTSGTLTMTGGILYGNGSNTINMKGSGHMTQTSGTFVQKFTAPGLVTGIKLNGTANASCNSGADPGVIHNATTTPTHLDAACGAGTGLGSAAFVLGGASVANF